MEEIKLSIAIPTYGSPIAVRSNVKRILSCERNDIEVVVVDNDETGEQLKGIVEEVADTRFYYFRNKKNIGRSNNIVKAIEVSKADFVLLLSSDDELYMDAVEEILETIDRHPDCGIILGTIRDSWGKTGFDVKKSGIYSRGYSALMSLPFLGNLMPMVVNKKYIDLSKCYNQKEYYMQMRLALLAVINGDLIYLNHILGYMWANEDIAIKEEEGIGVNECLNNNNFSNQTWDTAVDDFCYYTYQARVIQLKQYLEIIETCNMRLNQKTNVIEYWVSKMLANALNSVVACRSPFIIKHHGFVGVHTYEEVLKYFEDEMKKFFAKREAEKSFYFIGHLRDMLKNERILLQQAEQIWEDLDKNTRVGINGKDSKVSERFRVLLGLMGKQVEIVSPENQVKDMLILEPRMYDSKLDHAYKCAGIKKIYYLDRMAKYLAIVWCSNYATKNDLEEYGSYVN